MKGAKSVRNLSLRQLFFQCSKRRGKKWIVFVMETMTFLHFKVKTSTYAPSPHAISSCWNLRVSTQKIAKCPTGSTSFSIFYYTFFQISLCYFKHMRPYVLSVVLLSLSQAPPTPNKSILSFLIPSVCPGNVSDKHRLIVCFYITEA